MKRLLFLSFALFLISLNVNGQTWGYHATVAKTDSAKVGLSWHGTYCDTCYFQASNFLYNTKADKGGFPITPTMIKELNQMLDKKNKALATAIAQKADQTALNTEQLNRINADNALTAAVAAKNGKAVMSGDGVAVDSSGGAYSVSVPTLNGLTTAVFSKASNVALNNEIAARVAGDIANTVAIADTASHIRADLTNNINYVEQKKWDLSGNSGTTTGNFIGTTDLKSLRFRTNNIERMKIDSFGRISFGNSPIGNYSNYQLSINDSAKSTLQSGGVRQQSLYVTQNHDTTILDNGNSYRGAEIQVSTTPQSTTSYSNGFIGIRSGVANHGTGTINSVIGNYIYNVWSGGYVKDNIAIRADIFQNGTGKSDIIKGASVNIHNSGAEMKLAKGYISIGIGDIATPISKHYGFWAEANGKIDTAFAYYVDNSYNALISAVGQKWAFYNASTAPISTQGNVGIGVDIPLEKLEVIGRTKSTKLQLTEILTPSSSSDTQGNVGDIAKDDNYIYVKTPSGWKRSALSTF